jgi:hypothetical protein
MSEPFKPTATANTPERSSILAVQIDERPNSIELVIDEPGVARPLHTTSNDDGDSDQTELVTKSTAARQLSATLPLMTTWKTPPTSPSAPDWMRAGRHPDTASAAARRTAQLTLPDADAVPSHTMARALRAEAASMRSRAAVRGGQIVRRRKEAGKRLTRPPLLLIGSGRVKRTGGAGDATLEHVTQPLHPTTLPLRARFGGSARSLAVTMPEAELAGPPPIVRTDRRYWGGAPSSSLLDRALLAHTLGIDGLSATAAATELRVVDGSANVTVRGRLQPRLDDIHRRALARRSHRPPPQSPGIAAGPPSLLQPERRTVWHPTATTTLRSVRRAEAVTAAAPRVSSFRSSRAAEISGRAATFRRANRQRRPVDAEARSLAGRFCS